MTASRTDRLWLLVHPQTLCKKNTYKMPSPTTLQPTDTGVFSVRPCAASFGDNQQVKHMLSLWAILALHTLSVHTQICKYELSLSNALECCLGKFPSFSAANSLALVSQHKQHCSTLHVQRSMMPEAPADCDAANHEDTCRVHTLAMYFARQHIQGLRFRL